MQRDYWRRQSAETPLFPNILWSRPESKQTAGKLLIVGGNAHGFAVPAQAYQDSVEAGIGTARVLLPDVLQKTVGRVLENGEFAPSTPSGGFATKALDTLLMHAQWADAVLLAGEFGRNAETTILLENFIRKYQGLLVVTRDTIDYFYAQPELLVGREHTVIVLSLSQLQKLGVALHEERPFLLSMGLMLLADALHAFSVRHQATIITKELDNTVIAHQGDIISAKTSDLEELWRVRTATRAAVYWLQNPSKPLESIASSLI